MALGSVLRSIAHRPWPLPAGPCAMTQWWRDLLFAHWPVEPEAIRHLIPASLDVDTFDGKAWVAVVPFRMTGVRPRLSPALPGISRFDELNLRTYVRPKTGDPEHRGVYFWSLDASSRLAVAVARKIFHLPYKNAAMSCARKNGWIEYSSRRTDAGAPPAQFVARYRPAGPASRTPLADWLTERYCLYTTDPRGNLLRGDVHHERWPLMHAEAEIDTNTLPRAANIAIPETPPLLHFAEELQVAIWPLARVNPR